MERSDQKYIEQFLGFIIGIMSGIIVFYFNINLLNRDMEIVNAIMNIAGIIFGFLFASLAMIVQGTSSKLIELMTERKVLFNRIIKYNRFVVILSLIVAIISFIILIFKDCIHNNKYINAFYSFLIIMMFCYTITFLRIFYSSIIDKKN